MHKKIIACLLVAFIAQALWSDATSLNSQTASDITKGSRIQTTADGLSVRESYGVDDETNIKLKLSREIIKGDTGEVTDGPQEADGYVWWKIKYDFDGTVGWSAERSLTNPDIKYFEPESVPNQPENFESWRDEAINWATKLSQENPSSKTYYARCLKFVACAFQQNSDGASGYVIPNHEMPYALDVAKDLHRFNQEPNGWEKAPAGALIFFDKTASNDAGHIGFKNKDGGLIESYGIIRLDTIINDKSFLERGDVGKYLGWSYPPDTWSPPPVIASPGRSSEPGENIGDTMTPTFRWKKAPNAEYYALYIRKEPFEESNKGPIVFNSEKDYGRIEGDAQGTYLAFSLPSEFQLENGKKYRWNMCAVSNSGSGVRGGHLKSGISDTLYFDIGAQGNSQEASQSSISTQAGADTNPVVQSFQVTPQSLTLGESFTIDYTVSDEGGSGLKQVELWRKDESRDWQEISTNMLAGKTDPISGSFTDSPLSSGKYWYGLHVVDNAGNWNDEKNSNTNDPSIRFEPVVVGVKKAMSLKEWALSVQGSNNDVYNYQLGLYYDADGYDDEHTKGGNKIKYINGDGSPSKLVASDATDYMNGEAT